MTNLDSIFKNRHYFANKGRLVKTMVFPIVMYGCQSWTIKKAEHRRIDAFELWCWRRLLKVPWTARRSNQSILKEISSEYSSEGLMLKLKLQYFGHLTCLKRPWCWERLKMEEEGDDRGWDGWMASLTQWTWVWVSSRSWWWTGKPGVLHIHGVAKSRTWLSNWTELSSQERGLRKKTSASDPERAGSKEFERGGTSLVVQWLRLHPPNAGDPDSILGQGTRSCVLQLRSCVLAHTPLKKGVWKR